MGEKKRDRRNARIILNYGTFSIDVLLYIGSLLFNECHSSMHRWILVGLVKERSVVSCFSRDRPTPSEGEKGKKILLALSFL